MYVSIKKKFEVHIKKKSVRLNLKESEKLSVKKKEKKERTITVQGTRKRNFDFNGYLP